MNRLFRLQKYLHYQWHAKTKYYLHSPFVFQLYLNVLEDKQEPVLLPLQQLRHRLANDTTAVQVEDMGAGSISNKGRVTGEGEKKIESIEKNVAVHPKYGGLLYRLVKYFQPKTILELGTSIGISSAYLALANPEAEMISLEGAAALIDVAVKNHASLGIRNVQVIKGNFDDTLPVVLQQLGTAGLVFFDGNHRKDASLRYFNECLQHADEQTIFVFDDIYWSEEMYGAWQIIKQHPRVTLSIDVFQFGICFFMKGKMKEDFMLRY